MLKQPHCGPLLLWLSLSIGCEPLIGLDGYRAEADVPAGSPQACEDATVCPARAAPLSSIACLDVAKCMQNVPARCPYVFGAAADARSLHLGALVELTGPDAAVGAAQARSAELAVSELNAAGGIQLRAESERRPLTLVVCDQAVGAAQSARALVEELEVQAIVGPTSSRALVEVAREVTVPHGVVLLGVAALTEEAKALSDGDLSWSMLASEQDRVPMVIAQVRALESRLRVERGRQLMKLAFVVPRDGGMRSSRMALVQLEEEARGPAKPVSGRSVSLHEYDSASFEDAASITEALLTDLPDIVVFDGGSQASSHILGPLELTVGGAPEAPHYVFSEGAQVPELLAYVGTEPALQPRVNVVAALPTLAAQPVYQQFERSYRLRYGVAPLAIAAVAATYDAVYTLAYALAAADDPLHERPTLAGGVRRLSGGSRVLSAGRGDIAEVIAALSEMQPMTLVGTLSELSWTGQGSPVHGMVGTLCLSRDGDDWSFVKTGFGYDIASGAFLGHQVSCDALSAGTGNHDPKAGADAAMPAMDAAGSNGANAASTESIEPNDPAATASRRDAADIGDTQDAGVQGGPGAQGAQGVIPDGGPIDATVESSAEPDAVPVAVDIGLAVQYRALNSDAHDTVIGPELRIVNRASELKIELSSLVLRYYFTHEHAELCPTGCAIEGYYAGLEPSGVAVAAQRSLHLDLGEEAVTNAYIELTFPRTNAVLAVGESVVMQQQFHTEPYRELDESNDYSFRQSPAQLADWDHVTLHRDGELVWGRPPAFEP